MVFTSSLLGARHLRDVVVNKPLNLIVVLLGKALNGTPHLCVEDSWPIHLENSKRVRTYCPKQSDKIRFLVNGG